MYIKKFCITLVFLLFVINITHSQESHSKTNTDICVGREFLNADTLGNNIRINKRLENVEVHFRFDRYNLELDYLGNEKSLQDFANMIDSIGVSKIDSIVIISQSSPEGVQ